MRTSAGRCLTEAPFSYKLLSGDRERRVASLIARCQKVERSPMTAFYPRPGTSRISGSAWPWLRPSPGRIAVILFRISGKTVPPSPSISSRTSLALLLFVPVMLVLGRPFLPAATGGGLRPSPGQRLPGNRRLGYAVSHGPQPLGAGLLAIVDCVYTPVHHHPVLLFPRRAPESLAAPVSCSSRRPSPSWPGKAPGRTGHPPAGPRPGNRPRRPGHAHRRDRHRHDQADARPHGRLLGHVHEDRRRDRRTPALPALPPEAPDDPPAAPRPLQWKVLVPASLLGSFLSLFFWVAGMKFALASVAAVLNQMNVIFVFILAAIFLGEKATPWKVGAVALAFVGAFLASFPF